VAGGREARLRARDVEADDAEVAVAVGQLGDLQGACGVPHGGEQRAHADAVAVLPRAALAHAEALVDRLDDLFEGEALLQVLLGGVPDLGVDHAVLGEVLGALSGHAREGVLRLHHRAGVREGLQIPLQGAGVGRLAEPDPELVGVGLGQSLVPVLPGEVDDRAGAQATVEVIVEEHLRGAADLFGAGRLAVRVTGRVSLARHFGTLAPTRVELTGRYVTVTLRTGGVHRRF
jgi:hypothetical protein